MFFLGSFLMIGRSTSRVNAVCWIINTSVSCSKSSYMRDNEHCWQQLLRLKNTSFLLQKAIKERNIDLSDIEANIIGTEKEKQPPPEKQLVKTHDMCLLTQSRNSGIAEMQSNSEQKNPSQLVNEIETFGLSQE